MRESTAAKRFAGRVACLGAIAEAIRAKLNPNQPDITTVMGGIAQLLDASITGADMPAKPAPVSRHASNRRRRADAAMSFRTT